MSERAALTENKEQIRRRMLDERRRRDSDWVRAASRRVEAALMQHPVLAASSTVGCYLSMPGEVQTAGIIDACHAAGKRVCAPAYEELSGAYRLAWLAADDSLEEGPLGVNQPAQPRWVDDAVIELIILPGVAFDRAGGRLGHGKGHIDRMMKPYRGHAITRVGLAFDYQLLDHIPRAEHDVRMDFIITEGDMI